MNLFLERHPRWAVPLKNPDQPCPTHTTPDPHSLRKERWCLILNRSHHRPQSETKLWRCRKGPSVPHAPRGGPTPHSQSWALRAPAPPLSTGLPPAGLAPRVLLPGGDPGRLHFPKSPEGSTPGSDPLPHPSLVSPSHASCILLDFGPLRGSEAPDETVKCPLKVHGNHFQRVV